MSQRKATIYTWDPDAAELLLTLCADCGLKHGRTFCVDGESKVQLPYAGENEGAVAVVFGPVCEEPPQACAPVISLKYWTPEIVRTVKASAYGNRRIAVVLPRETVFGRLPESSPADCGVFLFCEENYESRGAAVRAAAAVADVIAGPSALREETEKTGLPFLHLLPGRESAAMSSARGREILDQLDKSSAARARLDAYSKSVMGGIVEVDQNGRIVNINEHAKMLLQCRQAYAIGQFVLNYIPQIDMGMLEVALKHGYSIKRHPVGKHSAALLVNIEPILIDSKPEGAVIFLSSNRTPFEQQFPNPQLKETGAQHNFSMLSYVSPQYTYMVRQAKMMAYTDEPILISGEEGTEAGVLAECIHNASRREGKRFAQVECNALDTEQVRAMLFEESGDGTPCGVEACRGGTIFLRHVDKLSPDMQYAIYTLIAGWYSTRNSVRRLPADVRVIAGTSAKLRDLVREQKFREDLYYVLSVAKLCIPSIRERKGDVPDLISYFIDVYGEKYGKHITLSNSALNSLIRFEWPGNVRQMDSFIQKLVRDSPYKSISETYVRRMMEEMLYPGNENLQIQEDKQGAAEGPNPEAVKILEALRRNHGVKIKTAEELGISKATLWRKMQKYGITSNYSV